MSTTPPSELGNLAQSARSGQLRTARIVMLVVGGLSIAVNGFLLANASSEVEKEIQGQIAQIQRQGMAIDPAEVESFRSAALTFARLIYGAGTFLGFIFIVLGIVVYRYPVVATVTGLVLYIGAWAAFGLISPELLYRGLVIRILIVVALFSSVRAAIAYQREKSG